MNILLIASRDPRGQAYGRKMVLRTIIQSLSLLGHQVTTIGFGKSQMGDSQGDYLGARLIVVPGPWPVEIVWNFFRFGVPGRLSLNECLYFSPRIGRRIKAMIERLNIDFVITDMIRTAEYGACAGVPWLADLDDLLSARYEAWNRQGLDGASVLGHYGDEIPRFARKIAGRLAARLLRWESRVVGRREIDVARQADQVSLVSEPEARYLAQCCGRPVRCLPMALDVPNGLQGDLAARPMRMAFTGGLDYRPNLEAVSYFVGSLAPALADAGMSQLQLNVFGHCPEGSREALRSDQLLLHGYVDDLYRELTGCQVFLAPIRSGTGVKTKVVEAMLLGMPVVTTEMGAQGLDVRDGEQCYLFDTPGRLVTVLKRIEAEPESARRVAESGRKYARDRFTPGVLRSHWEEALQASERQGHSKR